jgi:hypothetical protein
MRRVHRLESALATVLLLAIPPVLILTTGSPLRSGALPSVPIRLAADLVWLIWAWCALGVVRGTISRVARRDLSHASDGRPLDRLSRRLASVVLALMSVLAPSLATGATNRVAPSAVATTTATATQRSSDGVALSTDVPSVSSPSTAPHSATYVVRAGDCLWSIAAQTYGDGDEWTMIAQANLGHVMGDGRLFANPSLIFPGWVLSLPDAALGSSADLAPASSSSAPTPTTANAPTRPPLAGREGTPASPLSAQHHEPSRSSTASSPRVDRAVVVAGALGTGTILLGLLRRRRRREGPLALALDDPLLDADVELANLDLVKTATLLERAVLLCDQDDALRRPGLLALDSSGARLWEQGRSVWRAEPPDLLDTPEIRRAPCVVVPLGTSGETTWSLLVPPGHVGLLGGPRASELIDDALRLQEELIWGHLLLGQADDAELDDPASLRCLRSRTPQPGAAALASDDASTAIVVGDQATELTELQLLLAPERLSSSASTLLDALPGREALAPPGQLPTERGTTEAPREPTGGSSSPMVRLLSAQPRLDGLTEPLEPRRSRRAVELVAYLALHRPDPVTGERLRTRVLGTSDADAAAKTLFNVASAARRSLGKSETGTPLLPPASRQGHYLLGEGVSCDVELLYGHLARAEAALEHDVAIAELRAALELIEAEPLSSVLVGWEWFVAEGHRGRLEGAIEQAGELVVSLCLDEGLGPLAEQCLVRAQRAVPYSETLAAAAMEVAGALGDVDRLRRAFDAYGRLVEELEPGSWPLSSAEDRYRELRAPLEGSQASLAAIDAAPRSTRPSAPAAL